jgi:hypothetical protein
LNNKDKEYLLFERLTKAGLDKSRIKICSFSSAGNLEFCEEQILWNEPIFLKRRKNLNQYKGFHTENYWTLPSAVEKAYLDLLFKERKAQRDSSVVMAREEKNKIIIINKIIKLAEEI